jgi:SulP family sulfate permease
MAGHSFEPKLLTVLREGYSLQQLGHDAVAGIVVGIVALPLAIAFAIASGVAPAQGIYTAIVAGFLISALGGSRVQIGGPTGAFIVLVFEIVHRFGYDGLAVATILAGGLLITMGLARLGGVIQYIPYPVTVGFTAGIAVIVVAGQVPDALGLEIATIPTGFVQKWAAYAGAAGTLDPSTLGITALTMAILVGLPRLVPRVPPSIVAIVVTTGLVSALGVPVETIGERFGEVPSGLPRFRMPSVDLAMLPQLISPAVSIALLAAIESLLSAVVADGMTGGRHRSNTELIAQGVANIASPLFGGIPATGAIARTATNVKNGGRTPVAGMVHVAVLAIIVVVAGRWVALVPMPTLAGILFVVAYHMSEARLAIRVVRGAPRSDVLVLLSTFTLTVLVDLTVGIQVGVVLAAFLFMRRMVDLAQVRSLRDTDENDPELPAHEIEELRSAPSEVEVFEVNGPFFFGAAHKFSSALGRFQRKPKVLVLRMRNVFALDATGLRVLESLLTSAHHGGPALVLSGVCAQPRGVLDRAGFTQRIGPDNIVDDLKAALDRSRVILAQHGRSGHDRAPV